MVNDPVCLMEFDPRQAKAVVEYEGRTYYFCSSECKEKFLQQPRIFLDKAPGMRMTVGVMGSAGSEETSHAQHCARCHGEAGNGTKQGPPLVHEVYRPGHHPDLSFHRAVNDGVQQHHWKFGNMPPVPAVSAQQAEHIIAYVRHLQFQVGIR